MNPTRKRIDTLIGSGRLTTSHGQCFDVEYELRTYQDFVDGRPGPQGADGAIMTLDPKPWIPPGEAMTLELEEGRSIAIRNREPFTTDEWCLIEVVIENQGDGRSEG